MVMDYTSVFITKEYFESRQALILLTIFGLRWLAMLTIFFSMASESERLLMLKRLREIANPTTTSLIEPEAHTHTRGRPKIARVKQSKSTKRDPSAFEYVESIKDSCSPVDGILVISGPTSGYPMFNTTERQKQKVVHRRTCSASGVGYIDQLPTHLHDYVTETKDVASDGHCGFRVIAALLGFGENAWSWVRRDLLEEITSFQQLYAGVYNEHGRVEKQMHMLNCFDDTTPYAYWMTLPETGYLIASRYNVALVTLSPQICCIFLPLRTPVVEPPRCICIAHVNENHFIQVFLCEGHPLPPVIHKWYGWRDSCATG